MHRSDDRQSQQRHSPEKQSYSVRRHSHYQQQPQPAAPEVMQNSHNPSLFRSFVPPAVHHRKSMDNSSSVMQAQRQHMDGAHSSIDEETQSLTDAVDNDTATQHQPHKQFVPLHTQRQPRLSIPNSLRAGHEKRTSMGDLLPEAATDEEDLEKDTFHADFNASLEMMSSFLKDDVLNAFDHLLSMRLCPLQTPLQLEPHHARALPLFKQIIHDKLQEMFVMATRSARHLPDLNAAAMQVEIPDLSVLKNYSFTYNRPQYQTKIVPLVDSLATVLEHCQLLWRERDDVHQKVRDMFEQSMLSICCQITKVYERVCPKISKYVDHRVQEENAEFHEKYAHWKENAMEVRKKFYSKVVACTDKQVKMLLNMISIVEKELLTDASAPPYVSYAKGLSEFTPPRWSRHISLGDAKKEMKQLRLSLNTWQILMVNHKRVDNDSAILPNMLTELQGWLLRFQRIFLLIIGEKIPDELEYEIRANEALVSGEEFSKRLEETMQPQHKGKYSNNISSSSSSTSALYPPMDPSERSDKSRAFQSVSDSNYFSRQTVSPNDAYSKGPNGVPAPSAATASDPPASSSSSSSSSAATKGMKDFMGLSDLAPSFKEFFQAIQTQNGLLCRRHEIDQHRLEQVQNQYMVETVHLKNQKVSRDQHFVRQQQQQQQQAQFVNVLANFFSMSNNETATLEQKSHDIRKQLELEHRLQYLEIASQKLKKEYEKLKPRLLEEHGIREALNKILGGIHGCGAEYGETWITFINEERKLTHEWSSVNRRFHERCLNYRQITRCISDSYVRAVKEELALYIAFSFSDLNFSHQELMSELEKTFNERRTAISNAMQYADYLHCQIEAEGLVEVCQAVVTCRDKITDAIIRKDKIDRHMYKMHCHGEGGIILEFIETAKNMLKSLFEEKLLHDYLHRIDVLCCHDNATGSAPRGRPICDSNAYTCATQAPRTDDESNMRVRDFSGGNTAPIIWVNITEYPPELDLAAVLSKVHLNQMQALRALKENRVYHGEAHEQGAKQLMDAASAWTRHRASGFENM
jgi:hypothetical protein